MIFEFAALFTKRVMFGQYASLVNEIHSIRYDQTQLAYYDAVAESRSGLQEDARQNIPPKVFAPFISPGSYGGIKLTPALLKVCFAAFMKTHEPHMQTSFQMVPDEGIAMDHTHKFSNSIYVTGRTGRVFTASLTGTGLGGEINWSRMTFTKSHAELELLFQQLKEVRLNAGQMLLKRFETDNLAGDRALLEKHFPELKDGVVPCETGPDGCMKATISSEMYVYIKSCSGANNWARSVLGSDLFEGNPNEVFMGLDGEWNIGDTGMRLLQVSLPGQLVAVIDLQEMEVHNGAKFPDILKRLLQLKCMVACGSQIGGDCGRLEKIGVNIDRHLDLKQAAMRHDSNQPHGTRLQGIVHRYLGLHVDKFGQREDWSTRPLDNNGALLQYAALDALLSRQTAEEIV